MNWWPDSVPSNTPREFMGFTLDEAEKIQWFLENFEKIKKMVEVGHESESR